MWGQNTLSTLTSWAKWTPLARLSDVLPVHRMIVAIAWSVTRVPSVWISGPSPNPSRPTWRSRLPMQASHLRPLPSAPPRRAPPLTHSGSLSPRRWCALSSRRCTTSRRPSPPHQPPCPPPFQLLFPTTPIHSHRSRHGTPTRIHSSVWCGPRAATRVRGRLGQRAARLEGWPAQPHSHSSARCGPSETTAASSPPPTSPRASRADYSIGAAAPSGTWFWRAIWTASK